MTPQKTTLHLSLLLMALLLASGCAFSTTIQDKEVLPNNIVETKDKKEQTPKAKDQPAESERKPKDKKKAAEEEVTPEPSGRGKMGGISIDTNKARAQVETLSKEINSQTLSYREEFGVEDSSIVQAPKSCDEVCDLSQAICTSSEKICRIAASNTEASYFSTQCQWSEKECETSKVRCETCSQ